MSRSSPLAAVSDAAQAAGGAARTVGRVAGLLRKPWVVGTAGGVVVGIVVAPMRGRDLRHKVAGIVRAARSRPCGHGETPPSR